MPEPDDAVNLATYAIDRLGLSPEVRTALMAIQADVTAAYQKNFVDMVEAIRRQASALERLQTTLNLLVEKMAPEIKDRIPVALRLAKDGETPDVTSAVVVADPIATGYTMTQADLAAALGLSQPDVSVFVRAFKLNEDGECAVVVRKGSERRNQQTVNFHPRAIEKFRALVKSPPTKLTEEQQKIWKRVSIRLKPTST
jgi:hypothetical protein